MSQWPPDPPDDVIRITREEADSAHVDDLLKRQMSLEGSPHVARGIGRRWYYQNWFVFMIAGALGAFIAWALLEPHFDDMLYLQGPIEQVNADQALPHRIEVGNHFVELQVGGKGWLRIKGQQVWMLPMTKLQHDDGTMRPVSPDLLKPKQQVGVYIEYYDLGARELALARFIIPGPPEQSPADAAMTLRSQAARNQAVGLILFAVVAAVVGLAIGTADGIICRLARRLLLAGFIGLLAGFIGGFVSTILAGLVYSPLTQLASQQRGDDVGSFTTFGFLIQMGGRGLAWCLAGMAMGLGQGLALRSKRLLLYGLLGGSIGGLLGGLLFDPIDILLIGMDKPSSHVSRLVGMTVIGASVGAMIGVVELLARDAWLQMVEGPLAGKEFLLFKDTMRVGSSPRSDLYLFNDSDVMDHHAVFRAVGDNYEIENLSVTMPVMINGRPIQRSRLRHGDQIGIGRTVFVFQKRKA